jgi:hypothetical protein
MNVDNSWTFLFAEISALLIAKIPALLFSVYSQISKIILILEEFVLFLGSTVS